MINWNTLTQIEVGKDKIAPLELDAPVSIKVQHLEDSRYVEIEPGGMVDLAVNELGAKIIKVELIDS
jgi:hypothetical protein